MPAHRAKWIMYDSRKDDHKKGRKNNLSKEYIENLISRGCSYCGIPASGSKMTLDRINNTKGHIKSNVVPSCDDCNRIRGTLPYEAWLLLARGMRKARKLGLLKGWAFPSFNHGAIG